MDAATTITHHKTTLVGQFLQLKRFHVIVCCVVVFLVTLLLGWPRLPGPKFFRSYRQLQIGMPKSEVQGIFGHEPDYQCRVGRSEVWYYRAPGMFTADFPTGTPRSGTLYRDVAELPDVYDHVQIAFDEKGNVVAYTWIGETYSVVYRGGSVKGSHFKLLPSGVL